MERRFFLAVALSLLVIFVWSHLFKANYPPKPGQGQILQEIGPKESLQEAALPTQFIATQEVRHEKPLLFETDKYIVHFREKNGDIAQIELKKYPDLKSEGPTRLITDPAFNPAILSIAGLLEEREARFLNTSQSKNSIAFSCRRNDDLQIIKRYTFSEDNYSIHLGLELINPTFKPIQKRYDILVGANINNNPSVDGRFMEAFSSIGGKIIRDNPRKLSSAGQVSHSGEISYAGLRNKYFSLILKPFNPTISNFVNSWGKNNLLVGIKMKEFTVPPGSSIAHQFILYAGPNSMQEIAKLRLGFENSLSFGIFGRLSIFILDLLRFFYSFLHNWGLAIICLTFLASLTLFPLTYKSIKSMKEIQLLHPKIEKLRSQHKDNPQKFNKEVMQLYKKYKINPFGGCLPLLLQMPIFIALYQALMRSVELRGANFLWIKDLSSPDQASLPFSLPIVGNHINILPLLMVLAMLLQQKISTTATASPTSTAQQQKKMSMIMVLMFGIIFYNLPSGLVLYWFTNTLLSIGYNWRLQKSLVVTLEG
jgi:YidC/Oxa1 family membrane protein insertase